MSGLFFRENRHESCAKPEKEDARSDEANRDAPLEDGRSVGRWCELRHRSFQVHGPDNHIHSVENHATSGEKSSEKEQHRVGSQPSASKQRQRDDAPNEDFGREQKA